MSDKFFTVVLTLAVASIAGLSLSVILLATALLVGYELQGE